MQIIPIEAIPAQSFSTQCGGQNIRIKLYTLATGLYFDANVNGQDVALGVRALLGVKLIRQAYRGVVGNFIFDDTLGAENPVYTGLGARFVLYYLDASEDAQFGK